MKQLLKSSPGPWRNNGGQIEGSFGFPDVIATVGTVNEQSFTETANARLIAAAPDLLAALLTVRTLMPPDGNFTRLIGPGAWKQIDAAITKATEG